jgi:hypothetical protein
MYSIILHKLPIFRLCSVIDAPSDILIFEWIRPGESLTSQGHNRCIKTTRPRALKA